MKKERKAAVEQKIIIISLNWSCKRKAMATIIIYKLLKCTTKQINTVIDH